VPRPLLEVGVHQRHIPHRAIVTSGATSAKNAWAVGDYRDPNTAMDRTLVVHWNGKAWHRQL